MSNRRWFSRALITTDFIRDCADFEQALLTLKPQDAGPSRIDRVHVDPSETDGIISIRIYGRENA